MRYSLAGISRFELLVDISVLCIFTIISTTVAVRTYANTTIED